MLAVIVWALLALLWLKFNIPIMVGAAYTWRSTNAYQRSGAAWRSGRDGRAHRDAGIRLAVKGRAWTRFACWPVSPFPRRK